MSIQQQSQSWSGDARFVFLTKFMLQQIFVWKGKKKAGLEMSISDVRAFSSFHYDFPGVSSCPTAKTQLWMMKCSPFSKSFPKPFPRLTALQHRPLCSGKASSLQQQQQQPGRSRTQVWGAGREQAQSRGCAQEGRSLPVLSVALPSTEMRCSPWG